MHTWFKNGKCQSCRTQKIWTGAFYFFMTLCLLLIAFMITSFYLSRQGTNVFREIEKTKSSLYQVALQDTDDVEQIEIVVHRSDSVTVSFDDSDYIKSFSLKLGDDFVNIEDPTWWSRLHKELEQVYCGERGLCESKYFSYSIEVNSSDDPQPTEEKSPYTVIQVPTIEWLKLNAEVFVNKPMVYAMIDLPETGEMRKNVSAESYQNYIEKYPNERSELSPMQIEIDGIVSNYLWQIFDYKEGDDRYYMEMLDDLVKSDNGTLLYRYADGRYLVIEMPKEMLALTEDDLLTGDKTYNISAKVYLVEK